MNPLHLRTCSNADFDSVAWDGAWDSASLTSSPVMLVMLVMLGLGSQPEKQRCSKTASLARRPDGSGAKLESRFSIISTWLHSCSVLSLPRCLKAVGLDPQQGCYLSPFVSSLLPGSPPSLAGRKLDPCRENAFQTLGGGACGFAW